MTRAKLVFDTCAAPFGTGFFVSWWLGRPRPSLNPLVLLGIAFGSLVFLAVLMDRLGLFLGFVAFVLVGPTLLWLLAKGKANGSPSRPS